MDNPSDINNHPLHIPICVDLDGTLTNSDTLLESLVKAIHHWRIFIQIPLWLMQGKAQLKAKIAENLQPDISLLPYNEPLIEFLKNQKIMGRYLVLITAANQSIAESVNKHINLFDKVIGSDDIQNLCGKNKAKFLVKTFGYKRFCYIGNDRIDLQVWKVAHSGVLVNASRGVSMQARRLTNIIKSFSFRPLQMREWLKEIRPYQWVKNLLVFVPIITSTEIANPHGWWYATITFLAFCASASGTYILNDLLDLESDRAHHTKCHRPFASGSLSLTTGFYGGPILLLLGLLCASFARVVPYVLLYILFSIT